MADQTAYQFSAGLRQGVDWDIFLSFSRIQRVEQAYFCLVFPWLFRDIEKSSSTVNPSQNIE
jgi:hypothetical protein